MRIRTLTETLMEEEANDYRRHAYDKTASSYMFGHFAYDPMFGIDIPLITELFRDRPSSAGIGSSWGSARPVSSSFGSAIGSCGSGLQKGSIGNVKHSVGFGLQERFDFSGHDSTCHVNYDLEGSSKEFTREALKDEHKVTLWGKFLDWIY